MKITFLGTAAATSFPLTFCQCKNCKAARKHKGKSIRKRCSLLIDDKILIDLCPDFLTALNMYGKDISNIKYLLQTRWIILSSATPKEKKEVHINLWYNGSWNKFYTQGDLYELPLSYHRRALLYTRILQKW